MVRFCCDNCGHKISVQDKYIGKRGKCPECGAIVVIPATSTLITFHCPTCERKISVPKTYTGKKARCPNCKELFIVPATDLDISSATEASPAQPTDPAGMLTHLDLPREYRIADQRPARSYRPQELIEAERDFQAARMDDEAASATERHLPWFIDIFLYPTSSGGLLTLATLILLRLFTDIATVMLMCCVFGGLLSLIIRILLVWSYTYWYFSECVRDSAEGGLRAPDIAGRMPGLGDMFWHWARLFACLALFLGPMVFYNGYAYFTHIEVNNVILLSLLAFGAFFFPMNILAVIMFDSINGLNPILTIRSIISTFLQYCGLFILFYGLSILFGNMFGMVLRISSGTQIFSRGFFSYILFNLLVAYALLVAGHLLGRFYWLYQEKLNWEV
jgi:hypothetical protein